MNFILAPIDALKEIGYTVTTERISPDGKHAIVHMNLLGDNIIKVWGDKRFIPLKMNESSKLVSNSDWNTGTLQTITPTIINTKFSNPYMGYAPRAHHIPSTPYLYDYRLVFDYVTWRELEPTKGAYAFEWFETYYNFDYWASKGIKLIFRIVMDYPETESHLDIPDWLYTEINQEGAHYDISWGKGFSPNYDSPTLIARHTELITAFSQKYNKDPRIAFVEVGSVGQWGEWHTDTSIPFPNLATTDQYVKPYVDGFTNKKLLMRRPYQAAKDNKMGLINDGIGNPLQVYDWWLDWINNGNYFWLTGEFHPAMPDYWKYAPTGGEIQPGYRLQDSLQHIKDIHLTYIKGIPGTSEPIIDTITNAIGYRYIIKSVSYSSSVTPGGLLELVATWNNQGASIFWEDWDVELSLINTKGDISFKTVLAENITKFYPGIDVIVKNHVRLPGDMPTGQYTLCLAIIDPETNKPGIQLAIDGKREDGRYTIGQIQII